MGFTAVFNDNSRFYLFDSVYFNDKSVFNLHHKSNLILFSVEVVKKGNPIKVIDEKKGNIEFCIDEDFYVWFIQNQNLKYDFGFSNLKNKKCIKIECQKRNDLIIELLIKEIAVLKSQPKFNVWRLNGGYKEIEKLSLVTITSIQELEKKKIKYLKSTKLIFEVLNNSGLIDYSKKHTSIDPIRLLFLCETLLEKIIKLNKKKWWGI